MKEFIFDIAGKKFHVYGISVEMAWQNLLKRESFSLSTLNDIKRESDSKYTITIPQIEVTKL